MEPWIIAFVVVDLVVTALVVRHILVKRAAAAAGGNLTRDEGAAIPDLGRLREFTDAIHPRIGEIVRANWSGDSMSLPGVLGLALEEADREARSRNLPLERDILKKLVESSLAKHGVARGAQLREALKQVA
jgi:hypothetical protein